MSRNSKIIIAVAAIIVIFVGWKMYRASPANSGPIKIGVASLMTGDFATVGENVLNTAELTVDQIIKKLQ